MSSPHSTTPYEGREVSNADLARMLSEQNRDTAQMKAELKQVKDALLGTLDPPRQGLIDQVRDLKKKSKNASSLVWAAATAAASAAGLAIWNALSTGGHTPPTPHP